MSGEGASARLRRGDGGGRLRMGDCDARKGSGTGGTGGSDSTVVIGLDDMRRKRLGGGERGGKLRASSLNEGEGGRGGVVERESYMVGGQVSLRREMERESLYTNFLHCVRESNMFREIIELPERLVACPNRRKREAVDRYGR